MGEFTFDWEDHSGTESNCVVENFLVYIGDVDISFSEYNIMWQVEFGDFVIQSRTPYERTLSAAKESAERYINSKYEMFCLLAQTQVGFYE